MHFVLFKNFVVISLVIFNYELSFAVTQQNAIDLLIDNVIQELKPHHLTVFVKNKEVKMNDSNQITLSKLLKKIPINIVDNSYKYRKNNYFLYDENISSTLHVILMQKNYQRNSFISDVESIFKSIRSSIFYISRPKILCILHSISFSKEDVRAILNLSWKYKFLDFIILYIDYKESVSIVSYNPFLAKYHAFIYLFNPKIKLFPNKLNDINGYKLRIGVWKECWPECDVNRFNFHSTVYVKNLYNEYKYFAKNINASTIYLIQSNYLININDLSEKNLNFILISNFVLHLNNTNKILIRGYLKTVAIVPKSSERKLTSSWTIFLLFLAIFLIMSIFILIIYYLMNFRSKNTEWTVFNIYQILLGLPKNFKNFNLKQKILYFFLFLFSIFLASDVCTNITLFKYETRNNSLVTNVSEALEKNVTIYDLVDANVQQMLLMTSYDNEKFDYYRKIGKVMKKCKATDDISKFDNFIIIVPDTFDVKIIDRRSDKSKYYKTIETDFPPFLNILYFEEYSPFLKKYYQLKQRFTENGLEIKVNVNMKRENDEKMLKIVNQNNDTLILTLITVLVTGFFLSFIVFMYENIVWKYCIFSLSK